MNKSLVIVGVLFLILGLAALIHPEIKMPAKQREIYVRSQKLIINTQRIIQVPMVMGILLIVSGGAVVFLGTRKSA